GQFTNSRVTTSRSDHGTLVGPWTTTKSIVSTGGGASGTVIASPSELSNGGQDFTAWFQPASAGDIAMIWLGQNGGAGLRASDTPPAMARATTPAPQAGRE